MFESFKNFFLGLASIIAILGMLFLYYKIWKNFSEIKNINEKIEEQKEILNKREIRGIKASFDYNIDFGETKKEKKDKRKIEHKIEKLERKKKYLLEEISIYKIFKK